MLRIGLVGDPHFSVKNVREMDEFTEKIIQWAKEQNPDILIILGDILHTHAIIHMTPFLMAQEFLKLCSKICPTYLIIGNHDRERNDDFLTTRHAFNGLKRWKNLTIVDVGLVETFEIIDTETVELNIAMIPYVPPGRFEEAYKQVVGDEKIDLVLAHQEFRGCNLGSAKSEHGDRWSRSKPPVVSGHIHIKQNLKNIQYVGTPMQHEFGDESDKGVHIATLSSHGLGELEYFPLNICTKITKEIECKDLRKFTPNPEVQTRIILTGNQEELATIRQSDTIKQLREKGCKILYKLKEVKKITFKKVAKSYLETLYTVLTPEEKEYIQPIITE